MIHLYHVFVWISILQLGQGAGANRGDRQDVLDGGLDAERFRAACPDYQHYAVFPQ